MTPKRKRSLVSAVVLVTAALLAGFSGGAPDTPVDCRIAACVALTFDGGPGRYTGELLDVLARQHVPAAFFVLGKGPLHAYPDLVRRMAAEGHEVGNHSWTQPRLTEVPSQEARRQLVLTQNAVAQLTGRRPTLVRPPHGRTDERVTALCQELGLAQILGDPRPAEGRGPAPHMRGPAPYHRELTPPGREEQPVSEVLRSARRGGIVSLHDRSERVVASVPGIVEGLRARGFTLVSLKQLFAPQRLRAGGVYRHA